MKTIRFLLAAAIIITSVSVNAQNKERRSTKKQTTQNNVKTEKKSETTARTVTVQSQPTKTVNNVNRSQVTYKKQEPKVIAMRSDNGSSMKVVKHNDKDFYYNSGVFYRKYNSNYVKVAPPVGLRIQVIPSGYIKVAVNNKNYFYFEGTFYLRSGNEYIVETPPVGAIVYALPADYEKVELNGEIYYEYNGILYERTHYNGERAYQVVGYIN